MANPEHLEILNQGVKTWNRWRFEHPEIKPDFAKHYFDSESGEYVCLKDTKFIGANFSGADFTGADLRGVDFSAADLRGADLTGTNLVHANFYMAYLNSLTTSLRSSGRLNHSSIALASSATPQKTKTLPSGSIRGCEMRRFGSGLRRRTSRAV